jgi:hypothetical protein
MTHIRLFIVELSIAGLNIACVGVIVAALKPYMFVPTYGVDKKINTSARCCHAL